MEKNRIVIKYFFKCLAFACISGIFYNLACLGGI